MTFDEFWTSEMKAVGATDYKRESLFYALAERAWDAACNAAKKSEQAAWHAGLDAGREQGRGKDRAHPSPSESVGVAGDAVAMQPVAEIAMSDDGYKIGLLGPLRAHRLPLGTKLYASPEAAQQLAAVADATVARLTKDQRTRLVEKLVADQVEGADRMSSYLWGVLKNGFKGYINYTDQELLDAHWGAFDEDFFGLESGDDQ